MDERLGPGPALAGGVCDVDPAPAGEFGPSLDGEFDPALIGGFGLSLECGLGLVLGGGACRALVGGVGLTPGGGADAMVVGVAMASWQVASRVSSSCTWNCWPSRVRTRYWVRSRMAVMSTPVLQAEA